MGIDKGILARFNAIYKMLGDDVDTIINQYKEYENKEVYSEDFIKNKKIEKKALLDARISQHRKFIDEAVNVHISNNFAPNTNVIESLEYQTRLTNILTLLNASKGEINPNNLDFIVDAKDFGTMEALRAAYPKTLTNWEIENNPKYISDAIISRAGTVKGAMEAEHISNKMTRDAVLKSLE